MTNEAFDSIDSQNLNGKKIAIVGCATGFGRTLAHAFGAFGARLFLFDHSANGQQTADKVVESGGTATYYPLNVLQTETFADVFARAFEGQQIDGLIYMPRAREERDFRKLTPTGWDNELEVALKGAFFTVQSMLPYLEKNMGSDRFVIFMSSVLSSIVGIESVAYHSAKAGLDQLTRYLAVNLGPSGIRVNSIQIGIAIKDEGLTHFNGEANRALKETFVSAHPLQRTGTALDVVNSAKFLASSASSFITGHSLCLDGGLTLQEPTSLLNKLKK